MPQEFAQAAKVPLHWEASDGCLYRQTHQSGQIHCSHQLGYYASLSSIVVLPGGILPVWQNESGSARLLANALPGQTLARSSLCSS